MWTFKYNVVDIIIIIPQYFITAYSLVDFIQVDLNALYCDGYIVRFDLCGRPEINHRRHRSIKPLHLVSQLCLV